MNDTIKTPESTKKFSRVLQAVYRSQGLDLNIPIALVKSLDLKPQQPVTIQFERDQPSGKGRLIIELP